MSLDPALLFLSLITSGIGFVLFVYGKKQDRWPQLAGGLALMIYPYFVSTLTTTLVVGAAIVAAVWLAVRQGW
jgi:multisubunit Na+/H+ antiporter MnhC subunit